MNRTPYTRRDSGQRGAPPWQTVIRKIRVNSCEFVSAPQKIGPVADLPPPDDYKVEEPFQGQ